MSSYVNAAPMTVLDGIQDKSTRVLPLEPEVLPSHLPKVYLFAQRGPTLPQLVVGNTRNATYGSDTFDLRKPFAKHTTVLSNLVNAQGNAQMIERLIPTDAGPKSNFCLYLDMVESAVVQYERDANGSIVVDSVTGLPKEVTPLTTVPGYTCKWVIESVGSKTIDQTDSDLFGIETITDGDQLIDGKQSKRYPILQFWANSQGSVFNNSGLRIWSPTVNSAGGVNSTIMSSSKVYPFRMAGIYRDTANSTSKFKSTLSGEPYFDFTLKQSLINPATDAQFSLGDLYLSKYQSIADKRFPPQWADLNGFKIYNDNIATVLDKLFTAEESFFGTDGSDFKVGDTKADCMWLYNLFGFTSSSGVPYYSVKTNTSDVNSVRLSDGTNLYAKGGSDGTMNDEMFNMLVGSAVSEYANVNSPLLDTAIYAESIIYDSGFPLNVKHKLCNFISIRKDTSVVLSTYEVGGQALNAAEEHSLAVSLRTKLQNFPESDYFGTSVCRGFVFGRSGILRNSQFTDRLPLTLEVAVKAAKFMGAGDGKWKSDYLFDKAPNNIITMFDDVSIGFTPAQQRNKDWDVGLNYPLSYNRASMYFPALKSVYDDDTSVLNSFFTIMACVEIQKVGERVHRMYSGSTKLTDAQLIEQVNEKVTQLTEGRFAGMYQIQPAAFISEADGARGFSWTLPIRLYANNMKTAMNLYIQTYRMSDFDAAA